MVYIRDGLPIQQLLRIWYLGSLQIRYKLGPPSSYTFAPYV